MSNKNRYPNKDYALHADNGAARGIWSDGQFTMWVADRVSDKVFAYNLSGKWRDSSKEFNTLDPAGNKDQTGLWSDGSAIWVADIEDNRIYAYRGFASLNVSGVTATGATLTLPGGAGWHYQSNAETHNACSPAQSSKTAALSGLTPSTTYTYTAYSDSSCTTVIATASAFTTPAQ